MHARSIVRRLALVVGIAGTVLGTVVCVSGGFDLVISGQRLFRSHDWIRPFVAAALGWIAYVAAGGRFSLPSYWIENGGRRGCNIIVASLAVSTFIVGLVFLTTAVGGSDSYGYASQADLWRHGRATVEQPWTEPAPWPAALATFTPLAYSLSPDPDKAWAIVPSYPPGLPWLMAAAKIVGGQEVMFWIGPAFAAVMVLATYGIGVRLASPVAGLIAAYLAATSPVQVFMQMQAMSDTPAAGAWALAMYFLLGTTARAALAAGASTALAVAIRPNLAFGAAVLGLWYLVRLWRANPEDRRARFGEGLTYAVAAAFGFAAIAAVNEALNGSPLRFGYGSLEGFFSSQYVWPNARDYFLWLMQWQTPVVLLGFAALVLPIRAIWPAARDRAVLAVLGLFVLAVWVFYLVYLHFDAWWYLRFHLPVWPMMMVGVGAVLVAIVRRAPPIARVLTVIGVIALGAYTLRLGREAGAFTLWKAERHYPSVARLVRSVTDSRSVIISMQHSGSLRYYGGRVTLRYDLLDPAWLDRAVDWLWAHGWRTYLLIDRWEEPHVTERFVGQKRLELLQRPPVLFYRGPTEVMLYDLTRGDDENYPETVDFHEDYAGLRSLEPVPLDIPRFD